MGGVMPATPAEYRKNPLSGERCARLLEIAYNKGATESQMKQLRKTCSFFYQLKTGLSGSNFTEVKAMFGSFNRRDFGPKQFSTVPERIPTLENLVQLLTSEWTPTSGLSLVEHLRGHLAFWDGWVLGLRSNEDFDRIKFSDEQWFGDDHTWATSYLDGRAKLCMGKRNSRPWKAWRICMCPDAVHVPPPEDFEFSFDADGNPTVDMANLCTTCPVFTGELFQRMQRTRKFHCYRKWANLRGSPSLGKQNVGDLPACALAWVKAQKVLPEEETFNRNSGRKCLARWLDALNVDYEEGFPLHADLPCVWRGRYQLGLGGDGGYQNREQPIDPAVCTSALRKLRKRVGRGTPEPQPPSELTETQELMLLMASKLGIRNAAIEVMNRR